METLYKLKKHVIFLNEEGNGINFIKENECSSIIFESEKTSGIIVEFDWKIYRMRDFKLEKAQYEESGEGVVFNYISSDRKIIIKEEIFYTNEAVLARRVIVKPRYNGVIKEICIAGPKLKKTGKFDLNIITPFLPRISNREDKDIEFANTPEDSSGVFVVNSEKTRENCVVWFYSDYIFESGYKEREIIYKVKEKKELQAKEEIVAGIEFFSFYKGSYLENLENIEKFFRNRPNLPVMYDMEENREINKFFGKMLHYYIKGKISGKDVLKWIEVEKAVSGKRVKDKIYGYLESKSKIYNVKQKEVMLLLSAMIGEVQTKETELKYVEKIREENEIIKNGILLYKSVKILNEKNCIGLIKKYRGSFYMVIFNFNPFERNLLISVDKEFAKENLKGYRYILKNIIKEKSEAVINVTDDIELNFKGYECKILKFDSVLEENLTCEKMESFRENGNFYFKNNFFEADFNEKKQGLYKLTPANGEKAVIAGIKIDIDKELFKMKSIKNRVNFENEKCKMSYKLESKNSIEFKIEGNFENAEIIFDMNRAGYFSIDGKYIEDEVVEQEKFSEIKYFNESMIKFEIKKENCLKEISATNESLKLSFSSDTKKKKSAEIRIILI